jgi:hypothetical protein
VLARWLAAARPGLAPDHEAQRIVSAIVLAAVADGRDLVLDLGDLAARTGATKGTILLTLAHLEAASLWRPAPAAEGEARGRPVAPRRRNGRDGGAGR